MENKFSKMMFAFVATLALTVSTVSATWVNIQVTPGSYAGEISWSLNDASGTSLASTTAGYYSMNGVPVDYWVNAPDGCYSMELYDSYGDGWNGGTYQIVDSAGTVYSSGGLTSGSFGVDNVSINVVCVAGCTDSTATNYDPTSVFDDGSCVYPCPGNEVTLNMTDSWGDGWNGNVWNLYDLSGNVVATATLASGSSGSETFCIPDGCYTLSCDNGSYQSEVGWTLTDTAGVVLASGGAPDAQNLNLNSICLAGCMDVFATNYDPSAVFDDGSCEYPGCLDPLATNYCATCNVNDSLSCIYPVCHTLDFNDDFEAADLTGNGWTTLSGAEAAVALTTTNAIADTVSLEFTGGNYVGWNYPYSTELEAFGNSPDHVSSATLCMDLSNSAATVNMTLDAEIATYYTSLYGWFRVRIDTVSIADVNGNTAYNNQTLTGVNTLTYDLSAYAGQSSVYLTFEAACKYGPSYNPTYSDYVRIDNINIFNVYPCTYYTASSTATDASCNGGADGTATATVSSPNATSDTYLWSDGQTTQTAVGLAAGTYTCTTTDSINGCTATTSVTVGEPSALALSAFVVDATSPIANDGSVDLSVSGGTPCYSGSNSLTTPTANNGYGGAVFNIVAHNDIGISSIDVPVYPGLGTIDIYYRAGTAEGNELNSAGWMLAGSTQNLSNVAQLFNVPVSIAANAGDTIGIYAICSDGMQYTSGNNLAYTAAIASDANLTITNGAGIASYIAFTGNLFGPPLGSRNFAGTINYGTASYTYAWSTGATTEDVSGLPMGPISCTVTDCNGCTSTWSGFIMVNLVPGCMDTLASNYNPSANQDDGSCTYPGCTDSLASNYDPAANLNDSTCTYSCAYYGLEELTITFNSDYWASEAAWDIIGSNGDTIASSVPYANGTATYVTVECAADDCYTIEMTDSYGDGWGYGSGGIMITNANGDTLVAHATVNTGTSASEVFGVNSTCIVGCMDPIATNFDPTATISDSTMCIFCTDNLVTLNMYDSWGDGWNGNNWVLSDAVWGTTAAATTLSGGSSGSATFCIPDGCFAISCNGGSFQSEVSWDLVDANGNILASGGAPYSGNLTLGAANCPSGCMDPLASNYDSTAILPDSCAYIGCMDMNAINYDAGSNVHDSTLCVYPGCGTSLPYAEDFSSGVGADITLGWTAGGSISSVDSTNNGTFSWHGQGDSYVGWNFPYSTGPDAFAYSPDHIASGSLCIDLTAYAGQSIMMTFDLRQTYSFNATYSWFRVTDGTNVLSSSTGGDYYSPATADSDPWTTMSYDLSALAGTQATIVFESCGKYYDDYYQGGDNSFVDNINIAVAVTPVLGCTDSTASNYDPSANTSDSSCVYCGAGYSYVNINVDGGSFQSEVGWSLLDAAGTTVLSGGAPFNLDTCLADGCYSLDMTDSWGDGWNGNTFVITESSSGTSTSATLSSGSAGTASLSSAALGCYIYGCTDPLATNYDATANTDDGTCQYPGCADVFPYTEDFETGVAGDMTLTAGTGASSSVDSSNGQNVWSWQGQGGTSAGWGFPYSTGLEAFTNSPTHIATGALCVDLTGFAAGSSVAMNFDLRQEASYSTTYSWFRVKVDTVVLVSTAGMDYYNPTAQCGDAWATHTYDLSAYAGQSISIEFQSCGKYSDDYYQCGDNSYVDNINIVSAIYGCTDPLASNYNPAATADDGSCVFPCHVAAGYATGFEDGIAQLALTPADWMQNTDDNANGSASYGDWIHDALGTGSSMTGPNYSTNFAGNAYAMEGDYYMYVEASGNYFNDVSMTSHCFDLSTLPNATLKFWYNMYGSTMGSLHVDLSSDGGATWDSTWTVSGDQGVDWIEASIDASAYSATGVTVKITGTTGSSFYSDICIDAMSFVDGSQVYGCTDSTASNYNAAATIDDGSCTYPCLDNVVTMEMFDSFGDGWNGNTYDISTGGVSVATGGLSSGYFGADTLCLPTGCYDVTVGGGSFPSEVSFNFGSLVGAAVGSYTNISVGGAVCAISGCTDSTASNYDPAATLDDGSCTYPCTLNEVTVVLNSGGYASEISWDITDGAGTIVASGSGYSSSYTDSLDVQTLCIADDCYSFNMYDSWGDGWNGGSYVVYDASGAVLSSGGLASGSSASATFATGSASCAVLGCTDSTATNYDPAATQDDGSCIYPCTDNEVVFTGYDSWGDGWNGGTYNISSAGASVASGGLTSGSSFSDTLCLPTGCYDVVVGGGWYDAEISFDFGSLVGASAGTYANISVGGAVCGTPGCTDSTANNYDSTATIDDGSCTYDVYGCTDSTATNYDPTATVDDGSCIATVYGCTDPNALNYYPGANTDDGTCCYVAGCTDPTASNYNSSACMDDGSCSFAISGCTDPLATNYDPTATVDDGSCTYPTTCTDPSPTGAYVSDLIHDRARINWDNMNSSTCMVNQYRIRYREQGTSAWSSKTMSGSGLCIFGLNTTSKQILGLSPSTTYEYYMKAWYCGSGASSWSAIQTFTTADACPNVINFAASSPTTTKATFTWDTTAAYSFVRIKLRVDTTGASWTTAGGFGVFYPTLTKDKNGLTPGQPYRASARTWCDPNGGTYRSAGWTSPIFWTQPTSIRVEGGTAINNLNVYPNPSRDIFNVTFTSEDVQDLEVRVVNVVGKVVYTENLEEFVGEYTKSIDLATYTKGVYFLEITTNDGVVNKKLILQ